MLHLVIGLLTLLYLFISIHIDAVQQHKEETRHRRNETCLKSQISSPLLSPNSRTTHHSLHDLTPSHSMTHHHPARPTTHQATTHRLPLRLITIYDSSPQLNTFLPRLYPEAATQRHNFPDPISNLRPNFDCLRPISLSPNLPLP